MDISSLLMKMMRLPRKQMEPPHRMRLWIFDLVMKGKLEWTVFKICFTIHAYLCHSFVLTGLCNALG